MWHGVEMSFASYSSRLDDVVSWSCVAGSGGYSYLYEPLWWAGMITSKVTLLQLLALSTVVMSRILSLGDI